MADSSIQWTDAVWNPVVGCSRVSEGCRHCYAERVAARGMSSQHRGLTVLTSQGPRWTGEVRFVDGKLGEPYRWRRPRRVFVNSMSDLFHDGLSNEQIAAVFGVMVACPQHTFQILTKRPGRMRAWFAWLRAWARDVEGGDGEARICMAQAYERGFEWTRHVPYPAWPLPNVWLGVSCENQPTADDRIPLLLQTPAAVRFVSAEPLLGPVDLRGVRDPATRATKGGGGLVERLTVGIDGSLVELPKLDWAIVGGESGPGARACDMTWIRSIVEQCSAAGVACFVKQLGAFPHHGEDDGAGWADSTSIGRHWRWDETAPDGQLHVYAQKDRKGGDPSEWPEDLRVRNFPEPVR